MVMAVRNWYRVRFETRGADSANPKDGDMWGWEEDWYVNVRTAINAYEPEYRVTEVYQNIRDEWVKVWSL